MNLDQYKIAILIREFEQLLLQLFCKGKLNGTVHTCVGQELIPTLLKPFIKTEDSFFSNHRGHGHYLVKTNDIKGLLAEIMGKTTGCSGGYGGSQHLFKEKSFYSNGIQGGMAAISTGYAFSKKIYNKPGIAVLFLGDGTLGEGTLYEALNCAAIFKVPILFVLENNGYAQSTSIKQTFAGSTKKRFEGFGLKYFKGEIWSEDELQNQFSEAVQSARNFEPAVIEITCYRLNPHSKGDDNRSQEEIAEYTQKDPVNVFEKMYPDECFAVKQSVQQLLLDILDEVEKDATLEVVNETDKYSNINVTYKALDFSNENIRINELINKAFNDQIELNNKTVFIGEDIQNNNDFTPKPYGGAFKVTKDLSAKSAHVYNAPISEAAITGIGIGIALESESIAVTEIMFGDFTTLILDQLLQHGSKFQGMYGKKLKVPFILRTPMGGKRGYGPTHSQSIEKHFLGIYGINVIALNYRLNPYQIYSTIFREAAEPTIVIENKTDYTRYINSPLIKTHEYFFSSEKYPTLKITPKSIKPKITIFCYGGTLADVEAVIEELFIEHEISVEVICPSSLCSFNLNPLQESVLKTGKLLTIEEGGSFCGLGSEVIAQLSSIGVSLKNVKQIGNNSIIPSSYTAEINLLPNKNKIINTILKM
jgi:2-oxoisovalerate dehydrogenase E1 component